ncbi:DNA polymerase III subunit gamma/tau, partial [Jatrophihabitans endophyticus]|uniref:DNA polymerase III subunit gamma/tau n=1 Tax=Jatrophihabitans endophyticus TaxID=1206085 RepID=UPI0019DDAB7D
LVFVFATTEPDKVLTTIRSRTHHYPFRLIPPGIMRAHLESVCAKEGIEVEPAVLPLVVRAGGGSARDSLSILDQLLAGAGPEGVTYARAVGLLGVTDGALLDDMIDALAAGDARAVYGTVDRVVEAGHDPRRFSLDLLDSFRDLILLDAVPDAGERGLVDVPQDQLAHMTDQSARLGGATLTRFAEIVHTALIEMRGTTSPRLVLELLCARMLLPDTTADSAAVLQRLERLERRMSAGGAPEPAAVSSPPPPRRTEPDRERARDTAHVPARETPRETARETAREAVPRPAEPAARQAHEAQPTATVQPATDERPPATVPVVPAPESAAPREAPVAPAAPGTLDAAALRRLWPEVLEVVKDASRRTRALLDNAQITSVEGELVRLEAPKALAKMIAEDSNTSVLRAALTKVVGGDWKIDVAPAGTPPPPSGDGASDGEGHGGSGGDNAPAARRPEPEPDPRDDPDFEATPRAGSSGVPGAPDPEATAIKLLADELGARPLED